MSLQCDNLSGELQDQWSSSYELFLQVVRKSEKQTLGDESIEIFIQSSIS